MSVVKKKYKYSKLLVEKLKKYNEDNVLRIVDMPDKFLYKLREAYKEPGLPIHIHDFIHGGPSIHKKHILLPVKNQNNEEQTDKKGFLYEFWNFTEQSFLNTNEELTVVLHPNTGYCPIQDFVHKGRKYLVNGDGYVLDPNGGLMKDRDGGVSLVSWFVNSSQFIEGNELVKYVKTGDKISFIEYLEMQNYKIVENITTKSEEILHNFEFGLNIYEYINKEKRTTNVKRKQGEYNSILDFNFNDVKLLKELETRSLEHAKRVYGADRESGDKILLYFHFPYVEKTVTLHLHTRINSPQHNLELARSFMLEDIIEGLENEITIYEIIQQRIVKDCGYLLYEKFKKDSIVKKFLSQYIKDPSFNTKEDIDKYNDNAKYEIIDNPFKISNFTPKKFSEIPYSEPQTYRDYLSTKVNKCVLPEFKVKESPEELNFSENFNLHVEGFPRKKTKKKKSLKKNKKKSLKKKIKKRKKMLNKIKK